MPTACAAIIPLDGSPPGRRRSSCVVLVPGHQDAGREARNLLDLESVLAREEESGKVERLYLKDLIATQPDDPDDQACELSSVDEADWQTAEERLATIRPLLGDVRRTRESVSIQAQAAKVHTATVYHWLKLYERTGRVSALLPTRHNGGRGKNRLSEEVEAIINDTLENYYLKQQKPSAQKTCLEVIRLCRQAELKPPLSNRHLSVMVCRHRNLSCRRDQCPGILCDWV